MAELLRWYVWTVDGDYGYVLAEEKPQIFTWAWVWITPVGTVRPQKHWAYISKVENYN